ASASPRSILARRVATLPRRGTILMSGRRASNCALRRGDEVPIRAPFGSAARLCAPTSRSRGSARGSIAAIASCGGRIVSTSFIEWTDRSVRCSPRRRSSSLVHSALPPTSASGRILAHKLAGQENAHRPYGGVVPENAARAHVEVLPGLVEDVVGEAGMSLRDVDAIAATAGPGLIGGVMVGLVMAKGLALAA